jgi:hypothetical protein
MKNVLVNMNPWGVIHRADCPWMMGHLRKGWKDHPFKLMPANAAPANKQRCKMCKP